MPVILAIVLLVFGYWTYENWTKIGKFAYYWAKLKAAPDCQVIDELAEFCGTGLGFVSRDGTKSAFVTYTPEAVKINSSSVGDFCCVDDKAIVEYWTMVFMKMAQRHDVEGQDVDIDELLRSGRTLVGTASWTIDELVKRRLLRQRAVIGAHCDREAYSFTYAGLDPDYPLFPNVGYSRLLAAFKPPKKLEEAFNP